MIKIEHYEKFMRRLVLILAIIAGQAINHDLSATGINLPTEDTQQKIRVSGIVKDNTDDPLVGVSVVEKGTTNGTLTNSEGQFILNVSPEAVLVFSFLGYEVQEIGTKGQTDFTVVMNDKASELAETIIVAYGTQRKGNVLSSISSIGAKDIARTTSTTTSGALVGKMAGITSRQGSGTPGAGTKISIRNMGTPLYVIDGTIKDEGHFNNIDLNDIESISVLKDGAAAIYGVKASNGVILVKTKRGAKGKTEISLNAYTGWQQWARFPELGNAYEYVRGDYERRINSGEYVDVEKGRAELEKWRTGYYNPDTGEDYRGYDWTKFIRNDAPLSYVGVNISGGSDKFGYYVSLSHTDQDAVFKDYNFNRTNVQSNFDAQLFKSLKFNFSMNGRIETRDNPGLLGDDDYWYARFGIMNNRPTTRPYANDNENYPAYLASNPQLNLATMRKDISGYYEDQWRVFQGNWGFDYTSPLPGLTAKFTYGYYYAQHSRTNFEKSYNTYSYDYAAEEYRQVWSKPETYMQREEGAAEEHSTQFQINYTNTFNKVHNITAVLAAETYKRKDPSLRIAQSPVENNMLPVISDNRDLIAYLIDSYSEKATAGFAGRVSYDYMGKYLFEFSGRYDGSYRFPKGNRWGFFPSAALGYRISEEAFFKNSVFGKIFDNTKLRFSYGIMGDDFSTDEFNSVYQDLAYLGGYSFNQGATIMPSNPWGSTEGKFVKGSGLRNYPTRELTWAKSKIMNIGIDLGMLNNRLTMEFDMFRRARTGLPATPTDDILPNEVGIAVPVKNLNSDRILGFDGFVKWKDKVKDFNYSVGGNITFARKKFGDISGEKFGNSYDEYRNKNSGRWADIFWGAEVIGQFQSQEQIDNYPVIMDDKGNRTVLPGDLIFKDVNGDGIINSLDERPIGYGQDLPYLTFGLNLEFEWKGIDLSADFAGGKYQTIIFDWEAKWPFQGNGNSPKRMLNDRWHHEDIFDPTSPWVAGTTPPIRLDWQAGGSYLRHSTYFMSNTHYIRLKNLQIGYTLPKQWTQKAYLQKVRFYAQATNLFSLDNMKKYGIDPEPYGRNGLDYPPHKVYTIGINVVF